MDFLLLETGDYILQEDSYKLLLETSQEELSRLTQYLALHKIHP